MSAPAEAANLHKDEATGEMVSKGYAMNVQHVANPQRAQATTEAAEDS